MKIGITGASGMLGTALVSHLSKSHKVFATSRSVGVKGKNIDWDCFDLTDVMLLNDWLESRKPDLVIHCAAIVNVDDCESDVELATKLHVETTKVIANYLDNNGRLIYISTDSVFNGEKQTPYNEDDSVSPLNVYAKTKIMGEKLTLSIDSGLVLRVNIIGWKGGDHTSFAEWMIKGLISSKPLNLFYDVHFSPLHVDYLALVIERVINKPVFGLYHCASSDSVSKYDFGRAMAEIFHFSDENINKVSVKSMNFKAERPKNMALDIGKISSALVYGLPTTTDSIKLMKSQYEKNKNKSIK
jgi:dTDP-4-dehydrorhamnose reductase